MEAISVNVCSDGELSIWPLEGSNHRKELRRAVVGVMVQKEDPCRRSLRDLFHRPLAHLSPNNTKVSLWWGAVRERTRPASRQAVTAPAEEKHQQPLHQLDRSLVHLLDVEAAGTIPALSNPAEGSSPFMALCSARGAQT